MDPFLVLFWTLFGRFFDVFLKKCRVLRYLLYVTVRFTRILRGFFVVLFVFFFGSTQENLVFYESCFSDDEWRLVFYQKVSQTIENYREMTKVESLTYVFYDRCGTWAPWNTVFYDAIALLHFNEKHVASKKKTYFTRFVFFVKWGHLNITQKSASEARILPEI